jgi:hypothetical protein
MARGAMIVTTMACRYPKSGLWSLLFLPSSVYCGRSELT